MLLNDPNWLSSVRSGEAVELPVEELGDWMYAQGGRVYGAFTVNLMRSAAQRRRRSSPPPVRSGERTHFRLRSPAPRSRLTVATKNRPM